MEEDERYVYQEELVIFNVSNEIDQELAQAAAELQIANERYRQAILARISLRAAERGL